MDHRSGLQVTVLKRKAKLSLQNTSVGAEPRASQRPGQMGGSHRVASPPRHPRSYQRSAAPRTRSAATPPPPAELRTPRPCFHRCRFPQVHPAPKLLRDRRCHVGTEWVGKSAHAAISAGRGFLKAASALSKFSSPSTMLRLKELPTSPVQPGADWSAGGRDRRKPAGQPRIGMGWKRPMNCVPVSSTLGSGWAPAAAATASIQSHIRNQVINLC